MKSEVEVNKSNLRIADILYYTDSCNSMKYTITEIDEDLTGMVAVDNETGEEEYYTFSELQIGWEISNKSKEYNNLYFKTEYLN